jgi:uncharacterized protein (TIGR00730 family)
MCEEMGLKRVCVFCGSSPGTNPAYVAAARDTGFALARRDLELVYGGGKVGLMGVVSDTVLSAGGKVTGIIPDGLWQREIGHTGVTDLRVVGSMHERKAMMAEMSDGFIALPGGFGTFEEFCEAVTWTQLGLHDKPCGLLNIEGYYEGLLELFDRAEKDGFLPRAHRDLVLADGDPESLLERMEEYRPVHAEKWIEGVEKT